MNFNFSKTPLGKLRIAGLTEGLSFLVLLGIAMPLKYIAHIPEPVKIMGWIHGVLFIAYIAALIKVHLTYKWPLMRTALAFIASLLPFGTFIFDAQLRKAESELK